MIFLEIMQHKTKRAQSGDTIVEVLICIAILGAVMGGAYAIANQNTRINLGSQDRLSATKIAQSQLELLKGYAAQNPEQAMNISSPFCVFYDGPTKKIKTSTDVVVCRLNSASVSTTTEPSYNVAITKEAGGEMLSSVAPYAKIGQRYLITVTWDSNSNNMKDNVTYSYGVFK